MDLTDVLVRARHAFPGGSAVEALTPGGDPWLASAVLVLACETALVVATATTYAARGWRHSEGVSPRASVFLALAVLLLLVFPFFMPAATPVNL
jgi:hypothetical protein